MCQFKSGVITKDGVTLAPMGNESHSDLLVKMGINERKMNASDLFVRAELIPPRYITDDVSRWKYRVDQDIIPNWYIADAEKYEQMFRDAVKKYILRNYVLMCGRIWQPIKQDGNKTYYLLVGYIKKLLFGRNNNYAESNVRIQCLQDCDLLNDMKMVYGDRLVPITTDLTYYNNDYKNVDGYGEVEGDLLAIPTYDLLEECWDKIDMINEYWWLATPILLDRGPRIMIMNKYGQATYSQVNYINAVRPFCILKSADGD